MRSDSGTTVGNLGGLSLGVGWHCDGDHNVDWHSMGMVWQAKGFANLCCKKEKVKIFVFFCKKRSVVGTGERGQ